MCAELESMMGGLRERAKFFSLRKAYEVTRGAQMSTHQRSWAHERKIKCALRRDREGEGEGDRENQSDDGLLTAAGKGERAKFCRV
jgi:hypothetical protein